MSTFAANSLRNTRRLAGALAVSALIAAAALGGAQAGPARATSRPGIVFPVPGAMEFARLPAQIRGGHHFTMRGVMPLAIFGGVIHLQRQTPAGWQTLASAAVRPKVFWLHWMVPAPMRGTQLVVRFVLDSGGQKLAVSPDYTIAVSR